jgi:hypothetical protein
VNLIAFKILASCIDALLPPPFTLLVIVQSRDSAVGIATGYELDDRGGLSSSPGRVKNVLFTSA